MSKQVPIYIVDSFTEKPFHGNPAAVCTLSELPDPVTMQNIAKEMNLSETAFVAPRAGHPDQYHLKWFTPAVEVPLCGHATLATAHILFSINDDSISPKGDLLTFDTLSGPLQVKKIGDNKLQMNFPRGKPVQTSLTELVRDSLLDYFSISKGTTIVDIHHCPTTRKLVVELSSIEAILEAKINVPGLLKLDFGDVTVKGIILTAAGHQGQYENYDFVSRYFAPWVGITEDPVTGSAHTVLAVYWSGKLNKNKFLAFQASERGGEIGLELVEADRVAIEGHAITFLSGSIKM